MSVRVKNNMSSVVTQINGRAEQFVTAATTIGASWSKQWTPIAYSTLINSQNITMTKTPNGITGTVGFYTDYAKYLEDNDGWRPKPPPKYGKSGQGRANAWNKDAKPGFLKAGFESPEPMAEIANARQIFKA